MRLLPFNGRVLGGKILFDGIDMIAIDEEKLRQEIRWKRMSMIFQGAMNALNPVFRVGDQIIQAIRVHEGITKESASKRSVLGGLNIHKSVLLESRRVA